MTTPDWPERDPPLDKLMRVFAEPYVLELERRYAIAVEALEQCHGMGLCLTHVALAQCPPLPKEKERE